MDEEISNIERQRESTSRIVNEIESQISRLNVEADRLNASMALAQDNLSEKQAVLSRRLTDIYKRGPLYDFQVLLTAESFGDLLSRYKYLYLTSHQDRALLHEVEELADRVDRQRREIVRVRDEFSRRRAGTGKRTAALRRPGRRGLPPPARHPPLGPHHRAAADRPGAGRGPAQRRPGRPGADPPGGGGP